MSKITLDRFITIFDRSNTTTPADCLERSAKGCLFFWRVGKGCTEYNLNNNSVETKTHHLAIRILCYVLAVVLFPVTLLGAGLCALSKTHRHAYRQLLASSNQPKPLPAPPTTGSPSSTPQIPVKEEEILLKQFFVDHRADCMNTENMFYDFLNSAVDIAKFYQKHSGNPETFSYLLHCNFSRILFDKATVNVEAVMRNFENLFIEMLRNDDPHSEKYLTLFWTSFRKHLYHYDTMCPGIDPQYQRELFTGVSKMTRTVFEKLCPNDDHPLFFKKMDKVTSILMPNAKHRGPNPIDSSAPTGEPKLHFQPRVLLFLYLCIEMIKLDEKDFPKATTQAKTLNIRCYLSALNSNFDNVSATCQTRINEPLYNQLLDNYFVSSVQDPALLCDTGEATRLLAKHCPEEAVGLALEGLIPKNDSHFYNIDFLPAMNFVKNILHTNHPSKITRVFQTYWTLAPECKEWERTNLQGRLNLYFILPAINTKVILNSALDTLCWDVALTDAEKTERVTMLTTHARVGMAKEALTELLTERANQIEQSALAIKTFVFNDPANLIFEYQPLPTY